MAVEVRYHVIREGKEIAVYTSKKEADAHDKMLDIAEELAQFISQSESVSLEDDVLEELCVYLSKNRENVVRVLKGSKPVSKAPKSIKPSQEKAQAAEPEQIKAESIKDQSQASVAAAAAKKRRKAAGAKR